MQAPAGGDAVLNLAGDVFLHAKNATVSAKQETVIAQNPSKLVGGFGSMSKADIVIH